MDLRKKGDKMEHCNCHETVGYEAPTTPHICKVCELPTGAIDPVVGGINLRELKERVDALEARVLERK